MMFYHGANDQVYNWGVLATRKEDAAFAVMLDLCHGDETTEKDIKDYLSRYRMEWLNDVYKSKPEVVGLDWAGRFKGTKVHKSETHNEPVLVNEQESDMLTVIAAHTGLIRIHIDDLDHFLRITPRDSFIIIKNEISHIHTKKVTYTVGNETYFYIYINNSKHIPCRTHLETVHVILTAIKLDKQKHLDSTRK